MENAFAGNNQNVTGTGGRQREISRIFLLKPFYEVRRKDPRCSCLLPDRKCGDRAARTRQRKYLITVYHAAVGSDRDMSLFSVTSRGVQGSCPCRHRSAPSPIPLQILRPISPVSFALPDSTRFRVSIFALYPIGG